MHVRTIHGPRTLSGVVMKCISFRNFNLNAVTNKANEMTASRCPYGRSDTASHASRPSLITDWNVAAAKSSLIFITSRWNISSHGDTAHVMNSQTIEKHLSGIKKSTRWQSISARLATKAPVQVLPDGWKWTGRDNHDNWFCQTAT